MTSRRRALWGITFLLSLSLFGAVLFQGPGGTDGWRDLLGLEDRLGEPAEVEAGGDYKFLEHQPDDPGTPVTWDPCEEIEYEINPEDSGFDAEAAEEYVAAAIDEVSAISGLRFAYAGATDRRPDWREDRMVPIGDPGPVLVAWADADELSHLDGDTAGVGGSIAVPARNGTLYYVTGAVTLDEDDFADLDDRERHAVLLHELGHVVGLDHVNDPSELMFPQDLGRSDFGPGDRSGLVRLGSGRCS